MKLIVYTALFASEDIPLEKIGNFFPFTHDKEDVEYIAFTNRKDIKSNFWDIKYKKFDWDSSRLFSRSFKLNPHLFLPQHDYSIWMDHQCYFVYPPKDIVNHYLNGFDIAIHHHTDANSLAQEMANQAWIYKNDSPRIVLNQMADYSEEGFPMLKYDHFETGILLRKNNEIVKEFNTKWWDEVKNKSLRDQLSCPYIVWWMRNNTNIKINTIKESFTAHKGFLPLPKSKIFFTVPKPKKYLEENLSLRNDGVN